VPLRLASLAHRSGASPADAGMAAFGQPGRRGGGWNTAASAVWRDLSRGDEGGATRVRNPGRTARRNAEAEPARRPGRVHAGFSGMPRPAPSSLAAATLPW